MVKRKSKVTITVADGQRGMVALDDRRFEPARDWPVQFEVSAYDADLWLKYFSAECAGRGWSNSGIGQIDARENSGSITVNPGTIDKPQVAVVWERRRGGALLVRARHVGGTRFESGELETLFERVTHECHARVSQRLYMRRTLEYDGLPWRGEFWLDDTLRLGPPSRQYEKALIGPRVIVVDSLVPCLGPTDVVWAFGQQLDELAAFLSVVMGIRIRVVEQSQYVWTYREDGTDCDVRVLGYWENEHPPEMPSRGANNAMPFRPVTRPDSSYVGMHDQVLGEKSLPSDIADLWAAYHALSPELRRQFLQAAAKWQEALTVWGGRETLSVSLMVVACEALRPADPRYRDHNMYDIVNALLSEEDAKRLDSGWFRVQRVRSQHLHGGEFHGSEFLRAAINSTYQDPTFDEARRTLAPITREAIIEWLRRGGVYAMPPLKRNQKSFRRQLREKALTLLPVGAGAGVVLGWVLRSSWQS